MTANSHWPTASGGFQAVHSTLLDAHSSDGWANDRFRNLDSSKQTLNQCLDRWLDVCASQTEVTAQELSGLRRIFDRWRSRNLRYGTSHDARHKSRPVLLYFAHWLFIWLYPIPIWINGRSGSRPRGLQSGALHQLLVRPLTLIQGIFGKTTRLSYSCLRRAG
jgi:hypothetical protein